MKNLNDAIKVKLCNLQERLNRMEQLTGDKKGKYFIIYSFFYVVEEFLVSFFKEQVREK